MHFALYIQPCIIGFEYAVNDRKSEAGTIGFGRKKGVENRFKRLARHTATIIRDFYTGIFIFERIHFNIDFAFTLNGFSSV